MVPVGNLLHKQDITDMCIKVNVVVNMFPKERGQRVVNNRKRKK